MPDFRPPPIEDAGCAYNAFCSGGISEADPHNPKDNNDHTIMVFFRDSLARMLNKPAVKGDAR